MFVSTIKTKKVRMSQAQHPLKQISNRYDYTSIDFSASYTATPVFDNINNVSIIIYELASDNKSR